MNKKTIVLLILLMILSVFTYIKLDQEKKSSENSKLLLVKIENIEKELEMLKLQYKAEYESRNIIDIKTRKIYDSFINRDIEYLKSEVSSGVIVENDKITFENGYMYLLTEKNEDFVLRQRHYSLNEDKTKFITGYEILLKNAESIPVYNFEFINENGEWKLNNIYEE